ncbi:hypothetical protein ACPEF3_03275, partial [Klebsiella sp. K822]|uniref:hypothetical protein n=1 Tax=Klebsiella sp. K822 TaxID=3369405 RepID=UPI003C2CFCE3
NFEFASGWKPAARRFTEGPGRDSLLALFTTAVSRQGRRPDQFLLFSAQRVNTRRDKQQDAG